MTDDELQDYPESEAAEPRAIDQRRRRFPIRSLLILGTFAALVWFAPSIVCMPAVRDRLLGSALREFPGSVQISEVSAGWFSPITIDNLAVTSQDGSPLLTAARIESQRTLLGFAVDRRNLGKFILRNPKIDLQLRSDGSNLEDALLPLLNKKSSGESAALGLEIVEGQLNVSSNDPTSRSWSLEKLQGTITVPGSATELMSGKLSSNLLAGEDADSHRDAAQGQLTAEFKQIAEGDKAGGQIVLRTEAVPLDILNPLLTRFAGDYQLAGATDCELLVEWTNAADRVARILEIKSLKVNEFALAAPAVLGRDHLRSPTLAAKGRIGLQDDLCELEQFAVSSEIGELEASGVAAIADLTAGGAGLLQSLRQDDYTIRGRVDLARLARLLPETMRVRPGTEVQSGDIDLELTSQNQQGKREWDARITSSNLVARNQGRTVTWERPLAISVAAFADGDSLVIEKLDCQSSFLQAQGKGTLSAGKVTVQGDLNQLARELDQFLELSSTQLSGKMSGEFDWAQPSRDTVDARGKIRLEDFALNLGTGLPWQERLLELDLSARGVASAGHLERLEQAQVRLTSGADQMVARLVRPVDDLTAKSQFPIECTVKGNLASWAPRAQVVYPLSGMQLSGQIDLMENGLLSAEGLVIDKATMNVTQLTAVGHGLFIDDQELQAEITDLGLDRSGKVAAARVIVQSYPISFRADKVSFTPTAQGPLMAAVIGFRGDLDRILGCCQDPRQIPAMRMGGEALGQLQLSHKAGATDVKWKIDLTDFAYAKPETAVAVESRRSVSGSQAVGASTWTTVWSEPKLHLEGGGQLNASNLALTVDKLSVDSRALQVQLQGSVDEPSQRCLLNVQGEIAYNSAALEAILHGFVGNSIRIEADDRCRFALRGPLRNPQLETSPVGPSRLASHSATASGIDRSVVAWLPSELAAEANVGWSRAVAYGMPFGPAAINAKLAGGVLEVDPLDLEVSGGRMRFAPRVLLDRPEPLLTAEPGPLLSDVHLAPEMCGQWLKYVMPLLGDVTQAEGRLSLKLNDQAQIPVRDPLGGEVNGELQVHSATVGPGPIVREILSLALTLKSLIDRRPLSGDNTLADIALEIPEQRVPFHWRDRRVYHDRVHLLVREIAVHTSGSVGVDQTLDLVAELPIPDEWLTRSQYLAVLKGQSLKIPIGGTLSRPKIDRQVAQQFFRDITRETVTSGAGKLLEGQLNRGFEKLDKLLGPKNPKP
ncbi:MAG: DUF2125 domain-containing protein [Planctomycetes bacterium]|nr:DUF2125 domain-containing protein [Planctomycetota bacterium]